MAEMKLRTRKFTEDMDLGMKMFRKHKLALLPQPDRPPRHVKPVSRRSECRRLLSGLLAAFDGARIRRVDAGRVRGARPRLDRAARLGVLRQFRRPPRRSR